jgi:hypothetical protein
MSLVGTKVWALRALATVAGVALVGVVARWQLARHFVAEPRHEVVRRLSPHVEIRRYEPVVVAETRVDAGYDAAPSAGFRRLAGFIFGGNRRSESLAMTAPVTQASETLAMTAPVTQVEGRGASVIGFVMPAGRGLSSLPIPRDPSVVLREVPARTVAVLRYSGSTDASVVAARTQELEEALRSAGLSPRGAATSARYDPPSTLPFLRRNEIWLELPDGAA